MTDQAMSTLRRRMIEDMSIRKFVMTDSSYELKCCSKAAPPSSRSRSDSKGRTAEECVELSTKTIVRAASAYRAAV